MAQDNNTKDSTKKEFDIDEIEVELLVIAKNPKSIGPAAAFLDRRGWPTRVTSNVAQAIELIAERKPDFVLLSLNHPSPALARLPEVIQKSMGVECIVFVERMDTSSN